MQKQKRKTNHIHRAACALLAGLALSLGLLTGCGSDGSTIVVGKKNEKGYYMDVNIFSHLFQKCEDSLDLTIGVFHLALCLIDLIQNCRVCKEAVRD